MDYLIRTGRTMIKLGVEHPAITTRIPSPVPIWRSRIRSRGTTEAMAQPRSPLSDLEELELLRLGVEGKAAGWRTLRTQADTDARLDAVRTGRHPTADSPTPCSSTSGSPTPAR
jgi:hypothetical protein